MTDGEGYEEWHNHPAGWMSGGVVILDNLQLPWNRIVIVGFALAVLAETGLPAWLVVKTHSCRIVSL